MAVGVSDSHRSDRLVVSLHTLALAVAAARDPKDIYDAALEALLGATDATRAAVLVADDEGVLRFRAWRGLSDDYRRAVEGHSPWQAGERVASPVLVRDAVQEPSLARFRDTIAREGVRGVAFLPLFADGAVTGKFMLYADEPMLFSNADVRVAETIAAQIGFALARARSASALAESERKYRGIFEGTSDGIILVNADGYYLDVNDAMCRILRTTREQLLGAHFSRFIPRELLQNAKRAFDHLKITSGFEGLFPMQAADGTIVPVDWRSRAGIAPGVHMCVARDVTDTLRLESDALLLGKITEVLASSIEYETTLATVVHLTVPQFADWCAIDLLDAAGQRRRVAAVHADATQIPLVEELERRYPPREDSQRGVPNVLRTGRSEIYADVTEHMLRASARDDEHLRLLHELGIRSMMVVPLTIRGRTLGALTLATGPSLRRYSERDLRLAEELGHRAALAVDHARMYEQAREANRLKDDFLATLSHELRTPLNAIAGWARILEERHDNRAIVAKGIDAIRRNATTQEALVQDLLDVSRIVTSEIPLEIGTIDLREVTLAAIEAFRPAAESKGLALTHDIASGVGVSGDGTRLQQVIANLLSNAIKFTPKDGKVRVELATSGRDAVVRVSDTGEGISPAFLPHVFDRFRQGDSSSTRPHSGLGLGLAIVQHLVTRHGGTVTADSPGRGLGATFTVRLPLVELAAS